MKILDGFCYTGGFGIHILKDFDVDMTFLDIAEDSLEMLKTNLKLNSINKEVKILCEDVFNYFDKNEKFDVIILDPPSFSKSHSNLEKALSGYKVLHLKALNNLNKNGILITFSCSYYVDFKELLESVIWASKKSNFKIILLEKFIQSPDHPILLNFPQSFYLKGVALLKL
jgi:23S rRNA (cytosine1962-C5)-methyltransferase